MIGFGIKDVRMIVSKSFAEDLEWRVHVTINKKFYFVDMWLCTKPKFSPHDFHIVYADCLTIFDHASQIYIDEHVGVALCTFEGKKGWM